MDLNAERIILSIDPEFAKWIPPLTEEEYKALELSILEEGCRDAIIVWNGVIVDGHNRYNICTNAGIPFQTKEITFQSREEAQDWIDKNQLARRNLTPDQMRILRGRRYNREKQQGVRTDLTSGKNYQKSTSAEKIAQECGVSEKTIRNDAEFVKSLESFAEEHPDQAEAIFTGKGKSGKDFKTAKAALNDWKKEKKEKEKQQAIASISAVKEPNGKYYVIVIDPPWQYSKRAEDPTHRGRCGYPTMSIEEISKVEIPAEEDAILWLWTTNAFMHEAYHILDAWGFTPKTILTWVKDKMGVGDWLRGRSEHCILAVKGKPLINLTNQTTVLNAPMREHSRKPDEFYSMVEQLCPGKKIDMFSREPREGWDQWGCECDKF
jgi:N6-adenosine-specific RNA methylase IME4